MPQPSDEQFMTLALEACAKGIDQGQTPFGACIVRDGRVVACEHNLVWHTTDITAHAEMVAIRCACHALETIDLSGCTIYSTTEPCPMCFSAIHWAKIDRIVYGTSIADAKASGFNELCITSKQMHNLSASSVQIVPGCLTDRCAQMFKHWAQRSDRRPY